MPSDYGQHWTLPLNWELYGPCGCGAQPRSPCLDRRMKHMPNREMWTAHPDRQVFAPNAVLPWASSVDK